MAEQRWRSSSSRRGAELAQQEVPSHPSGNYRMETHFHRPDLGVMLS